MIFGGGPGRDDRPGRGGRGGTGVGSGTVGRGWWSRRTSPGRAAGRHRPVWRRAPGPPLPSAGLRQRWPRHSQIEGRPDPTPNPVLGASERSLTFIGAKISRRMKRFKASVIGGSGYGGAEIIRRLLIHPEVELVRVASVDYVGQPLGAAHPPLTGRTNLKFENLSPQDAAAGCDVALLGLPHKVSAEVGADAAGHGRQGRRHVGRLPAARRRRLRAVSTAPGTRTPSCWASSSTACPS